MEELEKMEDIVFKIPSDSSRNKYNCDTTTTTTNNVICRPQKEKGTILSTRIITTRKRQTFSDIFRLLLLVYHTVQWLKINQNCGLSCQEYEEYEEKS
jgi:hypothetical protein